jgi:DNA polymerase III subunit gamma/tau
VKYPPLQGAYKVIIIDEVHMLSNSAFNALLKTLEEPPRYLVFIFATTEVQKVLPTILSRTQRYDFRRIQLDEIIALLRKIADADGITIDDDALVLIAKKADGSARDAESVFDQVVAFAGTTVETSRLREALNLIDLDFYFEVSDAIAGRDPRRAFELSGEIISRGYDVEEFFSGLLEHFRNILTVTITNSTKLLEVSKVHQERYAAHAKQFSEGDLLRLIRLGQAAYERLKLTHDPRIVLEVTLVEMMLLERAMEISDLLNEVRALRGMGPIRSQGQENSVLKTPSAEKKTTDVAAPPPKTINLPDSKAPTKNPEPGTRNTIPDNEAMAQRWVSFGDFVRTKSKPLYSIFPEIEFCGVRRKDDRYATVYLGVPGKIEKDMLMNLKDEMQLALREFFGAPLEFEAGARTTMQTKAGSPIVTNPEIIANLAPAARTTNPERSELERALVERLGAQEV